MEKYVGKYIKSQKSESLSFQSWPAPLHPPARCEGSSVLGLCNQEGGGSLFPQLVVCDYISSQWGTAHQYFSSSPVLCCRNFIQASTEVWDSLITPNCQLESGIIFTSVCSLSRDSTGGQENQEDQVPLPLLIEQGYLWETSRQLYRFCKGLEAVYKHGKIHPRAYLP